MVILIVRCSYDAQSIGPEFEPLLPAANDIALVPIIFKVLLTFVAAAAEESQFLWLCLRFGGQLKGWHQCYQYILSVEW